MTKRMALAVLLVAVTGCGNNDEECALARKVAADVVLDSEPDVHGALRDAEMVAADVDLGPERIQLDASELERDLRNVEGEMGCVAHEDCCARMAKYSRERKADVMTWAHAVAKKDHDPLIDEGLRPFRERVGLGENLANFTAKETTEWCTQMRQDIALTRTRLAERWALMLEEAKEKVVDAHKEIATAKRRVAAVGQWAEALRKKTKPTVDKELDGDKKFLSVRSSVETYQTRCM